MGTCFCFFIQYLAGLYRNHGYYWDCPFSLVFLSAGMFLNSVFREGFHPCLHAHNHFGNIGGGNGFDGQKISNSYFAIFFWVGLGKILKEK